MEMERSAALEDKRKEEDGEEENEKINMRYRKVSECTSGNESDFYSNTRPEKFKKVTRLNSEQLVS